MLFSLISSSSFSLHFKNVSCNMILYALLQSVVPHVADITRLLTEYFRTCALPELRIKVYSIMKVLLMSMGIGK